MKVAIRADATDQIGSGHIMRCLTLANRLAQRGSDIVFFCQSLPAYFENKIVENSHTVVRFPEFNNVCNVSEAADAQKTLDALGGDKTEILIVDHYNLGIKWEDILIQNADKLIVIDDLANRRHACNYLVDQTIGRPASAYAQLVPDGCNILTGTDYCILRDEFLELRNVSLQHRKKARLNKILVTLGATDGDGMLLPIVEHLDKTFAGTDVEINVIVGALVPDLAITQLQAATRHAKISFSGPIDNLAQELTDTDLAIGAAGTSTWERCCLGVPSYLFVIAKNQIEIARGLEKSGGAMVAAKPEDLFTGSMNPHCAEIHGRLEKISGLASGLVDGNGVDRIIDTILGRSD